jgi:hypothetical protein
MGFRFSDVRSENGTIERSLAIAPDDIGRVLVVGSRTVEKQALVWLNLLTPPSLGLVWSEVWSEARIDGSGEALAIDAIQSGEFVVAGRDTATGSPWLQRYDADGVPLWPHKIIAAGMVDMGTMTSGNVDTLSVSVQSDGSIFLSDDRKAFVYCE